MKKIGYFIIGLLFTIVSGPFYVLYVVFRPTLGAISDMGEQICEKLKNEN